MLTVDIWRMIALHLKPLHLSKLVLTCRAVRAAVDTEQYWEGIAIHLMWRDVPAMDLLEGDAGMSESNMYDMVNLESGFYRATENILRRVRTVLKLPY